MDEDKNRPRIFRRTGEGKSNTSISDQISGEGRIIKYSLLGLLVIIAIIAYINRSQFNFVHTAHIKAAAKEKYELRINDSLHQVIQQDYLEGINASDKGDYFKAAFFFRKCIDIAPHFFYTRIALINAYEQSCETNEAHCKLGEREKARAINMAQKADSMWVVQTLGH